jgi:hypothetical protein
VHIPRRNGQLPAGGHRVASVHGEIQENLLHLADVGFDPRQALIVGGRNLDIFADQTAQHFLHVADDLVQVHDLHFDDLAAAQRE